MGAAHVWGCELAQDDEARAATQGSVEADVADDVLWWKNDRGRVHMGGAHAYLLCEF